MAKETIYYCNFCDEEISMPPVDPKPRGFGLKPLGRDTSYGMARQENFAKADIHICFICASSIRTLGPICSEGFKHDGGPNCKKHNNK